MSLPVFRLFTRIFVFCVASTMALDCSAVPAIMTRTFNRAKNLMPKNVMATIFSISEIETAKKFFTPKKIVGSFAVALAVDLASKVALKAYESRYTKQRVTLETSITRRSTRTVARIQQLEETFNNELIQLSTRGAEAPERIKQQYGNQFELRQQAGDEEFRKKYLREVQEAQQQCADEVVTRQERHTEYINRLWRELTARNNQDKEEIDSLLKKDASLKNYHGKTSLLATKLTGAFWCSAAFIAVFGSMRIRYGSPLYKLFRPILPTAAVLFPNSP